MAHFLVTGGCGFIGSALVRMAIAEGHHVTNLDLLTYAANPDNVAAIHDTEAYHFIEGDIRRFGQVESAIRASQPDAILHLAAETHVDRSIDGPMDFVTTNVDGTAIMLQAARGYWETLHDKRREAFRFLHISTDEVYGSLGETGLFTESSPYQPNSPYSASKAASDMMVRAWQETFGLPTLISNCSNNYGPFQFPEKLIPVVILNALGGADIPVFGDGRNVRDWLYVDDHAAALLAILEGGRPGQTYNVGGDCERTNIDLVREICGLLDSLKPAEAPYSEQIRFVTDRPGHDRRYAIDASKIRSELGWKPVHDIGTGLAKTVRWYVDNLDWCRSSLKRAGDGELPGRLGLPG